jgi:hypothetical protein
MCVIRRVGDVTRGCAAGTVLGICGLKMVEFQEFALSARVDGDNSDGEGRHERDNVGEAADPLDGQTQQQQQQQQDAEPSHDACAPSPPQASSYPVLRVMVNAEWVPLQVLPHAVFVSMPLLMMAALVIPRHHALHLARRHTASSPLAVSSSAAARDAPPPILPVACLFSHVAPLPPYALSGFGSGRRNFV